MSFLLRSAPSADTIFFHFEMPDNRILKSPFGIDSVFRSDQTILPFSYKLQNEKSPCSRPQAYPFLKAFPEAAALQKNRRRHSSHCRSIRTAEDVHTFPEKTHDLHTFLLPTGRAHHRYVCKVPVYHDVHAIHIVSVPTYQRPAHISFSRLQNQSLFLCAFLSNPCLSPDQYSPADHDGNRLPSPPFWIQNALPPYPPAAVRLQMHDQYSGVLHFHQSFVFPAYTPENLRSVCLHHAKARRRRPDDSECPEDSFSPTDYIHFSDVPVYSGFGLFLVPHVPEIP